MYYFWQGKKLHDHNLELADHYFKLLQIYLPLSCLNPCLRRVLHGVHVRESQETTCYYTGNGQHDITEICLIDWLGRNFLQFFIHIQAASSPTNISWLSHNSSPHNILSKQLASLVLKLHVEFTLTWKCQIQKYTRVTRIQRVLGEPFVETLQFVVDWSTLSNN